MLSSIGTSETSVLVPSTDGDQTGVSIVVEDNDSLSNCCVLSGFLSDSSNAVDGDIYLNNNKAECNDETTISACAELLEVAVPELISGDRIFTSIGTVSTVRWLLIKPATGAEWIRLEDGAGNALDTIRGERDSTFMIFHSTHTADTIREAVLSLEAVNETGETLTNPPSVMITLRQDFIKTLSVTGNKDRNLASVSGSEVIAITSNTDWRAELSGEFIDSLRFTPTVGETVVSSLPLRGTITLSGSGAGELSVFYQENSNPTERNSTLRLSVYKEGIELTTPVPIDITLTQEVFPTLNISGAGITDGTENDYLINVLSFTSTIMVNINIGGSAMGWSALESSDSAGFVTLSGASGDRMDNTLIFTLVPNTTSDSRNAIITISTTGGSNENITQTFKIIQLGQGTLLPTLSISGEGIMAPTSGSLHTLRVGHLGKMLDISLSIGGSAMGWRVVEEDEQDFISLPDDMFTGSSNDTLPLSIALNSTNTERIATLTFMTTGIETIQTLEITQLGAIPPTLMLTSPRSSSVGIANTATTSTDSTEIEFTVGGGATGWSSGITYSEGSDNFITLTSDRNASERGEVTIKAAATANTGVERMATITLTTMGGTGTAVTATVMITQAAGTVTPPVSNPPTLRLTSQNTVGAVNTATTPTDSIEITFIVGGEATGWTATVNQNFITLGKSTGSSGTDTLKAAVAANTGTERTATITLSTTGEGSVDTTITITQAGAPLSVSTQIPFTMYPNPTTGKLTIEGISGYLQIYLHNFAGKEVFASSLTSSRNTIDLSHLPSGMYVITLQREDKTWTEVLIIVN